MMCWLKTFISALWVSKRWWHMMQVTLHCLCVGIWHWDLVIGGWTPVSNISSNRTLLFNLKDHQSGKQYRIAIASPLKPQVLKLVWNCVKFPKFTSLTFLQNFSESCRPLQPQARPQFWRRSKELGVRCKSEHTIWLLPRIGLDRSHFCFMLYPILRYVFAWGHCLVSWLFVSARMHKTRSTAQYCNLHVFSTREKP